MKFKAALLAVLTLLIPSLSHATLRVVTTTTDLAAIAQDIGKDLIDVTSIAKGYEDPHMVEAKPSHLLKLSRADLFVEIGLELEVGWAPSLLTNAHNPKILPGRPGFLDVSGNCDILQKTGGNVDRSQGDVHPFGNPHYWLDPENGRQIARSLAAKLADLDPAHAQAYQANLAAFESTLTAKEKGWDAEAQSFKGLKVVTYHNSWPNFAKRFGLDVVAFVEPRPGIPPSPAHVQELSEQMKAQNVRVLLVEPYFDEKLPQKIAQDTGAKLLIFAPSVGAENDIKTYFDLFDHDLAMLKAAAGGGK